MDRHELDLAEAARVGWYWWRETNNSRAIIVEVDTMTGTVASSGTDQYRLLQEIIDGHWCGPLEEPR